MLHVLKPEDMLRQTLGRELVNIFFLWIFPSFFFQIHVAGEGSTQDIHIQQLLNVPLLYNLLLLLLNISQKHTLVNQEFFVVLTLVLVAFFFLFLFFQPGRDGVVLPALSFLRVVLLPLFAFCNAYPRSSTVLLAVSNGYFGSFYMMTVWFIVSNLNFFLS